MKHVYEKHFKEFVSACHRVALYGLVRCSSGNLSWRVDKEHMLVTATHTWMADLTKEQIAVFRLSDETVLNNKKPSAETGFHFGILRSRTDMSVVLHFQSPYATALACSATEPKNFFVIPEIPYYIGPIAVLPYMNPGSKDLAKAVISAMEGHDLVLLKNHGQVTVGKNFDDVIQKASFFELACDIILKAGNKIQFIPDKIIASMYPKGNKQKLTKV